LLKPRKPPSLSTRDARCSIFNSKRDIGRIHRVFSNLKTWALGVYHGLRDKHLQSYLDEFVFRFNRRRSRHAAFFSLFSIALAAKPVTYKILIEPDAGE
jgi:hypothetical protein